MDAERIAVIVGVGQVNDRPARPDVGLDSLGLMLAALRAADVDAGAGWLADVDALAIVDQLSFPDLNPLTDKVATGIGAAPSYTHQSDYPQGDSPILLLNEAANRIARGESRIAAIVGGEALRTAAQRASAANAGDVGHDVLRKVTDRPKPGYRQSYGLSAPVDIYPLYENASRAAYGQTLAQGQDETCEIWSRFSDVAAGNPNAWLSRRISPAEVIAPSGDNRPIAFPYTKLMVANASVNQGAALLVTSLAEARRRGVPEKRLVYVGRGAAAHEADDFLARDRYDRSASLEAVLAQTLALNAVEAADLDHVELYSCFPCIPKMARRAIDWPVERPATVFGGLTFGGGPIANYMSHAAAEMVEALRTGDGDTGLLFANGGFATRNHAIILSTIPLPGAGEAHDFNVQAIADALRGPVPDLDKSYEGSATIETYTVFYHRDGTAKDGVIVARTAIGARTLAKVPAGHPLLERLTSGAFEPVGLTGDIGRTDGESIWCARDEMPLATQIRGA